MWERVIQNGVLPFVNVGDFILDSTTHWYTLKIVVSVWCLLRQFSILTDVHHLQTDTQYINVFKNCYFVIYQLSMSVYGYMCLYEYIYDAISFAPNLLRVMIRWIPRGVWSKPLLASLVFSRFSLRWWTLGGRPLIWKEYGLLLDGTKHVWPHFSVRNER